MRSRLTYIALLIVFGAQAQSMYVAGKVWDGTAALEDIRVLNLNTERDTYTASDGSFRMAAVIGDVLLFSSIQFVEKRITITSENLTGGLVVQIEPLVLKLDEVTVTQYKNLTSEALGLVPVGQKQYTHAERKLATAGDFKPIHLLGLLGGSLKIDPILNAINGRTSQLKKEVQIEKKERLMEQINNIHTQEELVNNFKIPEDYVQGFVYYIVEDNEFANALKAKNDTMARFLLSGLSVKYLEIIADAK